MNRIHALLTFCSLCILMNGCSKTSDDDTTPTQEVADMTIATEDTPADTTSDMKLIPGEDMASIPDLARDMSPKVDTSPDDQGTDMPQEPLNLNDYVFTNRSGDCADFAFEGFASAMDVRRMLDFDGMVEISVTPTACILSSNAIPNHDFQDNGSRFASDVQAIQTSWNIPRNPVQQPEPTALVLNVFNGVMLNGVVLDLLAAGCFGVGDGRIGCGDTSTPYRYDPISPEAGFSTDSHNAHTQPDGRYHYHGNPAALYGDIAGGQSGVIGFAADGFPIYGPYIKDGAEVRVAKSGYTLKNGTRAGGPGGTYDGTFIDDYEFTDAGDLDECNGMIVDGQYGYYVTDSFPWVLKCLRGTPDPSFNKRR